MTARARLRGQPVVVLAMLLGGWVALRAALWESPFIEAALELPRALLASTESAERADGGMARAEAMLARPEDAPKPESWPVLSEPLGAESAAGPGAPAVITLPDPLRPALVPFTPAAPLPQRLAVAHNMLLMAGLSSLPLPPELANLVAPVKAAPQATPYHPLTTFAASHAGGRWSGDGWLLLRRDTTTALTSGQGSYGRSQAGGVLRYSFALSSPFAPAAYARVSQALGGASESEFALGLSARPVPRLPVRAAAELRVTQVGGRTLVRPAAYTVTELPPFGLPLGFTGEAYGQAGYVGGESASAFADGQLRAERKLAQF
ncbi:MAG: hypothetical protein H6R45_955, partial [Proteobacteria bacterium]|nr:hypothetical protein [Pseudomonadota bacterium]